MGASQCASKFLQRYSFMETFNDSNFGICKIYKKIDTSVSYALLVHRYIDQQNICTIQQGLKDLKNMYYQEQNFPFLQIYNWQIEDSGFLNGKLLKQCQMIEVNICIQFLRHNLGQFLEWRKQQNLPLTYDQIIMALNSAIKAFQKSKDNSIAGFSLKLQDISLTVEGQIKFNPLTGNIFNQCCSSHRQNTLFNNSNDYPIKSRIFQKRSFRQNNLQVQIYQNQRNFYSKQSQFLNDLKKLANQLIWDSKNTFLSPKNPEQSYQEQKKQIKRLLTDIHKVNSLKQLKKLIGKEFLTCFLVEFSKIKHEQSQARFERLTSQFSQKSQSTNYSNYSSVTGGSNGKPINLKQQKYSFY